MYSGLDHMYMALGDGSSPYAKTNQSPVDAGKWTHIVYAVDKDVFRLADILGHSSVETTRIYTVTSGYEHERRISSLRLVL